VVVEVLGMIQLLLLAELAVLVVAVVQITPPQMGQAAVLQHQVKEMLAVLVVHITIWVQVVVVVLAVQVLKVLASMYRVLVDQELHQA
jgi:hypothetical protein